VDLHHFSRCLHLLALIYLFEKTELMKNIFTILGLLIFTSTAIAQTGTIRGFVYDEETGEPVIFTNVFIKGTTYGASTDVNGYYSISKIPSGTYTVLSSTLGYDTASAEVTVKKGQIVTHKIILKKKAVDLKAFEVSAEKEEARTEVKMSVQKITPKEIQSIPAIGGEADLAQYLQVLPGVIFTGDQGGQLYIRGGSPIQNKVLLDGMIIYNPFHSIGLFSVFETDIIRNADIYTGGFNAENGGRISSVMDITTRDGNAKNLSGKVGASTFAAKAILEGPLKKQTKPGGAYSSFILTAKTSYLDKSTDALYNYIDNPEGLPYTFTDLYGKISFNGSNGSKFNAFGFNFTDKVDYSTSKLDWDAVGGGAKFLLVPQTSPVLIEGDFSYSKYLIEQQEGERFRSSGINGFNLGLDFTYFILDDEIKYGIEVLGFSTEFEYTNTLGRAINQDENTTEIAGYFKYKWNRGNWVIEPSFRAHYYAALSELSLEPRLGMKYNVSNKFRIKGAGGLYSQNLISSQSDRDVVNLFNGFLSGPENIQDSFTDRDGNTKDIDSKLQKAWHAILGFEYDVNRQVSVNVEGYYKYFPQLTTLNRYKIFDDQQPGQPDVLWRDFIVEDGNAYGVDMTASFKSKQWYFWAVYSIAYVDRWDGVTEYNPVFDRRHNVNLVSTYTFGKDLDWELSARWNFGSGFPFTQTQGFYEKLDFSDGSGTDLTSVNGDLGIQYAGINDGRLPSYHRMDVNLKKTFALSTSSTLETNVGVTNVYNRENIFYFNRIQGERVDQLPIMPSVGVTLTF